MKKIAKILIYLILILFGIFLILYFFSPNTLLKIRFANNPVFLELLENRIEKIPRGNKITRAQAIEVETIEIDKENSITIEKSGKTVSAESSQIVAQISGKVTVMNVEIGQTVKKGQLLAKLGDSLQTDLLKVQTSTALKSEELAEESLEATKTTAKQSVNNAETAAELALIAYNNALITRAQTLDSLENQLDQTEDAYDDLKDAQKELKKATLAQQESFSALPEFISGILLKDLNTQLSQVQSQKAQTKQAKEQLEDTYENQKILLDLSVEAAYEQCKNALNQIDAAKAGAILQKIQAKSQLLQANSSKLIAEINESYTTITAPFDGVISEISVDKNSSVNPGQPIIKISSQKQITVETFVNQEEAELLTVGQTATIVQNQNQSQATITAIAPFPDEITHKIKVKLTLNENSIPPGTNVQVKFKQSPENFFIPINSIFIEDNQKYVWLVKNGRAQKTMVTTGQIAGTDIEILSGLNTGDQIIKASNLFIEEGDNITTG